MKLAAYDAWVLARLLANQPVDGELGGVSGSMRRLADRLSATAWEGRRSLLEGYSLSLAEPAALLAALCDTDPMQHPPPPPMDSPADGEPVGDAGASPVRMTRAADIQARRVD